MNINRKNRKKRLLIVLAGMFLLPGGCQLREPDRETAKETADSAIETETKKQTGTAQTTENATESETENAAVSVWTMEALRERYPDKTILTWVSMDALNPPSLTVSDDVIEAVNEYLVETGADFVLCYEIFSESEYEQEINSRIAEGNAPDIICGGAGMIEGGTVRALRNDWLLELDDYLNTEEGKALWDAFPEKYWKTLRFEHHYYGVVSFVENTDYAYFVNKSLMEKYDITEEMLEKCPVSQLGDILQTVQAGEGDTYRLLANLSADIAGYSPIMEKHDNESDALVLPLGEETAQAVNLFEDAEAVNWFRVVAEYNQSGYLQGSDQYFIYLRKTSRLDNADDWKQVLKENFGGEDNIEVIYYSSGVLYPKGTIVGVCAASQHQEQALQALTLAMTDQTITDLLVYGTGSEEYTNEDGYVTKNNYNVMNALQYGNLFIRSPQEYEKDFPENYRYDVINETYLSPQAGVIFDLEEYAEQISQIQQIVNGYSGLFSGTYADVDATLAELNEKLHEAGIDEVLEEINRQLAEAKE